jgi:hypothetical protein
MFTTTFAAVALSVLLTGEALPSGVSWQTDYSQALSTAVAQQKPIAVFIGRGEAGYSKLVTDGQIPASAGELLSKNYVCVYVDTDTPAGKALSSQFTISSGLVISTKGGSYQTLRHTGSVSPTELTQYLTQYGDKTTVATTAERGVVRAAAPSPVSGTVIYGGCANGTCGTVVPTGYSAPAGYGVPTGYGIPAQQYVIPGYYGGGCANGRCPNAR